MFRSLSIMLMMMMIIIISIVTMIVSQASPQSGRNIDELVRELLLIENDAVTPTTFLAPTSTTRAPLTPTARQRSGFDTIVTPEPIDPSQPQPRLPLLNGRNACNCVPYHRCDPTTNMVIDDEDGDGNGGNGGDGGDDTGEFTDFGLIDLRFNVDDPVCEHFLDICCAGARTHNESLTPTPVERRPDRQHGCGIRNVGGLDFNLTNANHNEAGFGEFPWTVALLHRNNGSYFCAGSLIHAQVVLTAAHCLNGRPRENVVVRAGEWDSQTMRERLPYAERDIERINIHPQHHRASAAYDFALLVLATPMPMDVDHIAVVCLPAANATPRPPSTCISTGWGKDVFGVAGRYSTIMKRVTLPIVAFDACQRRLQEARLGPKFTLHASFVCAGGERNVDTCEGDGGAPLVCPIGLPADNRYHASGLVSWGLGCNEAIPAAYADVAIARPWIDQQMAALNFDTSSYTPPSS